MKYKPDFDNLINSLKPGAKIRKVSGWELFVDNEIVQAVLGRKISDHRFGGDIYVYLSDLLEFQLKMRYDYLPVFIEPPFLRTNVFFGDDTAPLAKEKRTWVDEHSGMITTWDDFHSYPWPDVTSINYEPVRAASSMVPEGMKVMVWTSGILENVQWLMGYENMAFASIQEPELVAAMFDKVGSVILDIYKVTSKIENVGLFAMGDDMGFKSGTLFSPALLKELVFPRHRLCVEAGHEKDIPFIMHSCGNLESVMDDLIDMTGIDAKHSFEDVILPVTRAKSIYSGRIALAGGIDIDFLARADEEQIRKRVRDTLDICLPGGGYVMGSGNSIANYIPVKNYLAMMDETYNYTSIQF